MMHASAALRTASLASMLIAPLVWPGIFSRQEEPAEPPPKTREVRPTLPPAGPLWGAELPFSMGPLPAGLANASTQGCAACHAAAVDTWSASGHAGPPSDALIEAAAVAERPDCLSCHLPLDVQHRVRFAPDPANPRRIVSTPNTVFDATLSSEGVTCAACHLRDGAVVGTRTDATPPHAAAVRSELGDASACATCHQLTWPGADLPLYDTFGEWERSGWAAAGVSCQSCHMAPDVQGGAPSHHVGLPAKRAVSVLVDLPPEPLVRGQPAIAAKITLQNTGAGHAFPTGSPFRGVRVQVTIEGPDASDAAARTDWHAPLTVDLARTLSAEPPWKTVKDTRLAAGGQRSWDLSLALPLDAPPGDYALRTRLLPTRDGVVVGDPLVERRLPLPVQ